MTSKLILLACVLALGACNVIKSDLLGEAPGDDDPPGDAAPDGRDPPRDMLITDFKFDDGAGTTAIDGARGLNGTLSDAAMWAPTGRNGGGILMNGTAPATQYVSLPNDLLVGTEDFTIAVWVRLTGNPAWARIYDIGNGLPDPAGRFMYLTPNGFTPAGMPDGIHASSYGGSVANESFFGTQTFLPLNVWKHVAITGQGGQRRLYIDGYPAMAVDNGPVIAPREMEPIAPNSWLGRSRFAADPGFAGFMDEFRIYSRVLTQDEIAELAWPQLDYAYWRFDESSGMAAADSSDNNLAGALANSAGRVGGRLGGGVSFNGGAGTDNGPHVVIAGNPLMRCSSQFTIALWLRINTFATGARVFDFGTDTTHAVFLSPTDGTGMHFGMRSPAGVFDLTTTTPPIPADLTWHHVAVTMDAGNVVVLFVDGVALKTQPSPTIRPADFAALAEAFLGRSRAQDPFFDGAIDELRIACRAFTADEIKNLARP